MIEFPAQTPGKSTTAQDGQESLFNIEYLKDDLKVRSVRGGAVTVLSQACRFALTIGSTVVLARLLTPADFGLIAMVTAMTSFAMMFRDLGLSMATVQKHDINHDQISTLFWINVGLGLLFAAGVAALGPAVAWFYREPRLIPVTMALAGAFVFGGLTVQHQALLRRHMRFLAIGIVEVVAMACAVAAAIAAGLLGAGYWSLVVLHVVPSAVIAALVWIAFPWRPGLPRKKTDVREMVAFGGNLTGFDLLNYFARNADNILIGKFIGSVALGFYNRAYNLMLLPIRQLNRPLSAVAIPSLSRLLNEPERYKRYYTKMILLLSTVVMPAGAFVIAMGDELILALLGSQWGPAGRMLCFFGLVMISDPIGNLSGCLYVSQGRGRDMLKWGAIGTPITVISIVIGLRWGALGVAISYSFMALFVRLPLLVWFVGRKGPVKQRDIWKIVWQPMATSFGLAGALYFLQIVWEKQNVFIQLGAAVVFSLIFLLIMLHIMPFGKVVIKEAKDLSKQVFSTS